MEEIGEGDKEVSTKCQTQYKLSHRDECTEWRL